MRPGRTGVAALVAGATLTIAVFLFHPSHASGADLVGRFSMSMIVHGAAMIAAPLLLYGMWELASWSDAAVARVGFAAGAIAMVLTVEAAVVSSFVTPAAVRASSSIMMPATGMPMHKLAGAHPSMDLSSLPPLVQVSVSLNRGLAQAHVALLSLGLLLIGLSLWHRSRSLALTGIAVGSVPLLWQLSGLFSPETSTMPVVMFPQSVWLIAAAAVMAHASNQEEYDSVG
jgi:hypothetical protein